MPGLFAPGISWPDAEETSVVVVEVKGRKRRQFVSWLITTEQFVRQWNLWNANNATYSIRAPTQTREVTLPCWLANLSAFIIPFLSFSVCRFLSLQLKTKINLVIYFHLLFSFHFINLKSWKLVFTSEVIGSAEKTSLTFLHVSSDCYQESVWLTNDHWWLVMAAATVIGSLMMTHHRWNNQKWLLVQL